MIHENVQFASAFSKCRTMHSKHKFNLVRKIWDNFLAEAWRCSENANKLPWFRQVVWSQTCSSGNTANPCDFLPHHRSQL